MTESLKIVNVLLDSEETPKEFLNRHEVPVRIDDLDALNQLGCVIFAVECAKRAMSALAVWCPELDAAAAQQAVEAAEKWLRTPTREHAVDALRAAARASDLCDVDSDLAWVTYVAVMAARAAGKSDCYRIYAATSADTVKTVIERLIDYRQDRRQALQKERFAQGRTLRRLRADPRYRA